MGFGTKVRVGFKSSSLLGGGTDSVSLGKGALARVRGDEEKRFCMDFVPKFCDNHVVEFANPTIKAACSACSDRDEKTGLDKLALDKSHSHVWIDPGDMP
eukprot:TRINITY_DN45095_c0_g1_i1.p2 TRINITY_DN45095_c0_g1~~TRINITY_DN45095_c0_g1_i1.p2  ORF type:complete len:100 (+),score=26.91 TRINITY_DN45095_c0_g1_i1:61-360(+)